jgi:Phasin protein
LARGLEALSTEMAGLALSGIDAAARTATDMLGIKTLSDAIEVNAGLTCSSFDTLVGGSAKLSELGIKLAAEASQPILTQLGKSWIKAARLAF